jgi:hypothetical protein
MLQLLDGYDGSDAARQRLIEGLDAQLAAVLASRGRGDRGLVARAEDEVKADPRRIRLDDRGDATVEAAGRVFRGGRFEVLPLCALRARAIEARDRGGRTGALRLWAIDGASPVTDIGALQAFAPPGSLFQVASQFNCLESPGRFVTDVAEYLNDPTQGPRASISALPGTLVRHYAARGADGERFVQASDRRQVELLADVCAPGVAAVHNGYLRSTDIADPAAFARLLEDRFEYLRVGVHDGVEVVLGADWDGAADSAPTIAQVFTSTLAAGMYGELDESSAVWMTICRQLQRAAYLGTFLAAAALGVERVVLTMIGGGVFANPMHVIWDAILWAADQVRPVLRRDLTAIVNGRSLGDALPPHQLRAAVQQRGGALIRLQRGERPVVAS